MSVRFSANTQRYTTSTGIPAGNVFTATCWAYVSVDRNTWSALWSLSTTTGSPNPRTELSTTNDGTTLCVVDSVPNIVGAYAYTVGAWFKAAVVVNGTNMTIYSAAAGATLTATSLGTFAPNTAPTFLSIGSDPPVGSNSWLNGRISSFKMWQAVLSVPEMEIELSQFSAVRTANLLRSHPFRVAETTDYSGNGNTLSGGTGATTEADPPISDPVQSEESYSVSAMEAMGDF
jgi:hypothetical protein